MGTDIHLIVQAKRGDVWETIKAPIRPHDPFCTACEYWFHDRNYEAVEALILAATPKSLGRLIPSSE